MTKKAKIIIGISIALIVIAIVVYIIKKKKENAPAEAEAAAQRQAAASTGTRVDSTGRTQVVVDENKTPEEITIIKDELQKAVQARANVENECKAKLAEIVGVGMTKDIIRRSIATKYKPLIEAAVSKEETWRNKLAAALKG